MLARKCMCYLCKSKGTTDIFYCVEVNGKKKYYCNAEEYFAHNRNKEKRYELMKYIAEEILEFEDGKIVPPVMVKKIEELNKFYDYDVIKECFITQKEGIHYWSKIKDFKNEFGKASYIMRIIENNINDTYDSWRSKQKEVRKHNNDVDLEMMNVIEAVSVKKNNINNSIMGFLDEEDL